MVLHFEVVKADGTGGFTLVSHWVVVFSRQSLRDLLDLTVELPFSGLELIVLDNGVRHYVNVGQRISNLDIANVEVCQHKVGQHARFSESNAIIFARKVH